MNIRHLLLILPFSAILSAQGLDPALLKKPATDAWPTYHGDYSGKRFSVLDQINQSNVNKLTSPVVLQNQHDAGPCAHRRRIQRGRPALLGWTLGVRPLSKAHRSWSTASFISAPRQRLGSRCALRPRTLALHLEDYRRHPHRQPRRRPVRQLAVHGNARLLRRLARRHHRQRALAQTNRRCEAAVLLHAGANHCRQSRAHRHGRAFT